ncbi:hypothetical protein [uncultured Sphingomonas sp.]|uniref:hypothetical protein n=1 Tax=uncultured Sphingomonas sp. TaxID=158754 RepID=UPI0035CAE8E9
MGFFDKPAAVDEARAEFSGKVARIAIVDESGATYGNDYKCHILFQDRPEATLFSTPVVSTAVALTRDGDEVRFVVDGLDMMQFSNLTTGLSTHR